MSDLTPERLAEWQRLLAAGRCLCSSAHTEWRDLEGLIDALESARAERDRARLAGAALVRLSASAEDVGDEVARLRTWKAEALEVLKGWDAVWEALDHPGQIGQQKHVTALAEVERLRGERDYWRGGMDRHGVCTCDTNPSTTSGPEEDCPHHGRDYAYWVEGVETLSAENARLRAKVARVKKAVAGEPLIVSGIRRDLDRTPSQRGGEVRHLPGTNGVGMSGCPGDNLVGWANSIRAAALADEGGDE